ncbi:MAG: class I SAM-dependent methyltransferase [Anaerolineales bacterium]|nr:class I SAM-dependent methyltransferase [Anaerolineales bacterium]
MSERILSRDWQDYQLLDSGLGRKLEQFGPYRLIRPEPRAVWKPGLPAGNWADVEAEFVPAKQGGGGKWEKRAPLPERWQIGYRDLKMWVILENSRQVGVFPENGAHWDWIRAQIARHGGQPQVLNLFGYTGLASLAAAKAGAAVTHIDSARRAVALGRDNQALNNLGDKPIRWIVEDAVKFARREVKRGNRYEGIIFDPPKYGLGPKQERWSFFEGFENLCRVLRDCFSGKPQFMVVTAYALESPPEVLQPGLEILLDGLGGELTLGVLGVNEKSAGRKLDLSVTARWSA